ncbi:MAG: class I SAM-dependent methyltransferase [Candidatus Lokiarchaeota archaeon]|nr:class I SAM-dependent methyltransferase [Candidatus Lokiarchaeota archaeon]
MKSSSKHWDSIFSSTEDPKLGWYEKDTSQTLELLNHIPKWKNSTVFLPGAGTSVLIEELLSKGVKLVLNDISIEALNRVKSRLGGKCKEIKWLCQDIAQPIQDTIPDADIWIDRAVLHFLTDEDDIKGYFENVKSTLNVGGYAIFAEFSKTGASECAGLKLHRYSIEEISENLGSSFSIVTHFNYTYINPFGDPRPYIYALYKRDK